MNVLNESREMRKNAPTTLPETGDAIFRVGTLCLV
jgi:hypothetical protein